MSNHIVYHTIADTIADTYGISINTETWAALFHPFLAEHCDSESCQFAISNSAFPTPRRVELGILTISERWLCEYCITRCNHTGCDKWIESASRINVSVCYRCRLWYCSHHVHLPRSHIARRAVFRHIGLTYTCEDCWHGLGFDD